MLVRSGSTRRVESQGIAVVERAMWNIVSITRTLVQAGL